MNETVLQPELNVEDINPETVDASTDAEDFIVTPEPTEDSGPSINNLLDEFKTKYGIELSVTAIKELMELKERIDTGDKLTNTFAQLPTPLQKIIRTEFAPAFGNDPAAHELDFMASAFINELFQSAELDGYLNEFNDVMNDMKSRTTEVNIENDARLDSVLDRVNKLYETRTTLREKNDEESAVKVEKTYEAFTNAITMAPILKEIEERPSKLNRAFKSIGDFDMYAMKFDSKFCCTESNVKVRTLEGVYWGLVSNAHVSEEVAKTICILVAENTIYSRDVNNVYDKWYVYYMTEVLFLLHKSTLLGDVTAQMNESVKTISNLVTTLKIEKEIRKGKGNKKRR